MEIENNKNTCNFTNSSPWLPSAFQSEDNNSEHIKLLRRTKSVLNRLVASNLNEMSMELINLNINTNEKLEQVALHIVKTACDMPMYIDLIFKLIQRLNKHIKLNLKKRIAKILRKQFEMILENKEIRKLLLLLVNTENKNMEQLKLIIEEKNTIIRFQNRALMSLIVQFFYETRSSKKYLLNCVFQLLDPQSDEKLDYLYHLLKAIKENSIDFDITEAIDLMRAIYLDKLNLLCNIKPRTRILLQNIIEYSEKTANCKPKRNKRSKNRSKRKNRSACNTVNNVCEETQVDKIEQVECKLVKTKHTAILHTTKNPFLPNMFPVDQKHNEKTIRSIVIRLLNKLLPSNINELSEEMLIYMCIYENRKGQSLFADAIMTTALKLPKYINCISKMIQIIVRKKMSEMSLLHSFRNGILDKLEKEFNNLKRKDFSISLNEEEQFKIRFYHTSLILMISEIYKLSMLTSKILYLSIDALLDSKLNDIKIECLYYFVLKTGQLIEQSRVSKYPNELYKLDKIIDKIKILTEMKDLNKRPRCLLLNLIEIRSNNWKVSIKYDEASSLISETNKGPNPKKKKQVICRPFIPFCLDELLFFRAST